MCCVCMYVLVGCVYRVVCEVCVFGVVCVCLDWLFDGLVVSID